MKTKFVFAIFALAALASACGAATASTDPSLPADEPAIDDAHGVLGVYEDLLPADVRVARRGDEMFALTEDYRIGRLTVELDDTDGDGYRVTSVTIELAEGPQTFELEAS